MEANFFTEFSTSKKWYIFNENSRNQIVLKKEKKKMREREQSFNTS